MINRQFHLVLIVAGVILVIFGGYEVVERLWFQDLEMSLIHTLHVIRGIGTGVVVSAVVGWYLLRYSPLDRAPETERYDSEETDSSLAAKDIPRLNRWFIHVRWLFCIVAFLVIIVAVWEAGILRPSLFWPLSGTILVLALTNLAYRELLVRQVWVSVLPDLQVVTDLVILTVLLHFSGGIENPFSFLYLFHIIIAGMMLSRPKCYGAAAFAFMMFTGLAAAEHTGFLTHYTLGSFPHPETHHSVAHAAREFPFVASKVGIHAMILFLTAYFTTTIMEKLRAEREQIRTELLHSSKKSLLEQFAAGVSHEIGNALNTMQTRLQLMRQTSDGSNDGDLRILEQEGQRIKQIIQGISRMSGSGDSNDWERCNINDIAREAISMLSYHPRSENITIKKNLDGSLPPTLGVREDFLELFLNLGVNSIEAMPDGGTMTVVTAYEAERIVMNIRDTGTGMCEDVQKNLFDPFFTTKQHGLGLGLCAVRIIVQSYNGEISVSSQKNEGTSITVTIPRHPPESRVNQYRSNVRKD